MGVRDFVRECLMAKTRGLSLSKQRALWKTEWVPEFIEIMRKYMVMGAIRYGSIRHKPFKGYTEYIVERIKKSLKQYEETGNKENLVDMANFCMIEYLKGDHPHSHFKVIERED